MSLIRSIVSTDVKHLYSVFFGSTPCRPVATTFLVKVDVLKAVLISTGGIGHIGRVTNPTQITGSVVRLCRSI